MLCLQEFSQGFGVNCSGMMSAASSVLFDGFKIKKKVYREDSDVMPSFRM